MSRRPPLSFFVACACHGVRFTRWLLVCTVRTQTLDWYERTPPDPGQRTRGRWPGYRWRRRFRVSTSRLGTGQVRDTNRTPLGLHRIARKIGGGWPVGAVFRNRRFTGYVWLGQPAAPIAHRILWLEGLEPGFNRGGNVDTFARYIYIHGLADEPTLGRPASRGCIHLAAADLLPLYDRLPAGTLVWIEA